MGVRLSPVDWLILLLLSEYFFFNFGQPDSVLKGWGNIWGFAIWRTGLNGGVPRLVNVTTPGSPTLGLGLGWSGGLQSLG